MIRARKEKKQNETSEALTGLAKLPMKRKAEEVDTKVFADVLLLTMLEIMGVERFRVALSMALKRHASDSHLKTEKRQASEFYNMISDLKYLGWQSDDFKM